MNGREQHILCVDDHADTVDMLAKLLRACGHRVTTASSLSAALSIVASEEFDALVADIGLSDGTGLDLARVLRRERPQMTCIAISGYGMPLDVERGRDAGFDHYLVKPIILDQILAALGSPLPAALHAPESPAPDRRASA
jgi:CheY-like chemotaxis protein